MALEKFNDSDMRGFHGAETMSKDRVRRTFALVHNGFLVLNQEISRSGTPCFVAYLPAWRRARDAWAAFYRDGWSHWKLDALQLHRLELLRWRQKFIMACALAEAQVPLYASL